MVGCTGRMGLEISGFIIGCLCVNVTLKNRKTISENMVVYTYASVQVAAKFLMRKLRQYPQTWQPAEMNTFPFKCIFFYFQFYSKISTNTENCTFLFNLRCFWHYQQNIHKPWKYVLFFVLISDLYLNTKQLHSSNFLQCSAPSIILKS